MNRNERSLVSFTMLGHAMFHTYELVIPIFVPIWLDTFSTTAALLGLIVGTSYAFTGIGALPSGMLADRFSGKYLVIACMAGMGGSFLLLSAAPNLTVLSLGLLSWGVAASIYHPAGLSLISRSTKARGTAFAYHGIAGNIGVATGPFLGTLLLMFFGWRFVTVLLVVPVILAIALALRLEFDETAAVDTDDKSVSDGRETISSILQFVSNSKLLFAGGFLMVFLIGNLYGFYYRGAFTFLPDILSKLPLLNPVRMMGLPVEPSQYVYSGLLMLGGVGQYVGGKLVDKFRAESVLIANFVILTVIAITFVPAANAGIWSLLLASGLLGFFVFLEAPVNQEVISKHVPVDHRGLSFGWTYIAIFGVGALGSAAAGIILTRWSSVVLFGTLALIATLATLIGVLLSQKMD